MKLLWVFLSFFTSCIINPIPAPQSPTQSPTKIVTSTPLPWPTLPSPIPSKTSIPFAIEIPSQVKAGEIFKIKASASEESWIAIWIDKIYPLGDMLWDEQHQVKYANVKLNTPGVREVDFKLNNEFILSQKIEVIP